MTAKKIGMISVIDFWHYAGSKPTPHWLCHCECGAQLVVSKKRLSKIKSCGCHKRKKISQKRKKIGTIPASKTRIYSIWRNMRHRCINPKFPKYENYGGRGIGFCAEWENFYHFYNDMHSSYGDNLTLDRIDNEKGYFKENCRWVSDKTQRLNKRNRIWLTIDGVSRTLIDWVEVSQLKFRL
jgi:hypothetical protein